MPDFAASLTRTFTNDDGQSITQDYITLSTDGTEITIHDTSNYATSTEAGAEAADFSLYRKITVTDDNGDVYTYSSNSADDPDETIEPGDDVYEDDFTYTPNAGDSLYTVRLITVPTWNASDAYDADDCVVKSVSGVITCYIALQAGTNKDPETQTAYWEEVEDTTTLPEKYNVVGHLAVARTIEEAQIEAIVDAQEKFIAETFASPLGNRYWVREATLDMTIKAIAVNVSQGNWTKVSQLISEGKAVAAQDCD